MAAAAVGFARDQGAAAVEAYPIVEAGMTDDRHVGTPATFRAAGLHEIHQPSLRRLVMRLDFERAAG